MPLDWKNLNWSQLAKSNVIRGNAVAIISGAVLFVSVIGGKHVDPNSQQAITDGVNQVADGVVLIVNGVSALCVVAGAVWSTVHRMIAQPENVSTIVPKKPLSPPA